MGASSQWRLPAPSHSMGRALSWILTLFSLFQQGWSSFPADWDHQPLLCSEAIFPLKPFTLCAARTKCLFEVVGHSAHSSGMWSTYNSQMTVFIHLELVSPPQGLVLLIKMCVFKDNFMISHKRYFLFRIRDSSWCQEVYDEACWVRETPILRFYFWPCQLVWAGQVHNLVNYKMLCMSGHKIFEALYVDYLYSCFIC